MRPSPKSDPGAFAWVIQPANLASLEPIRQHVLAAARDADLDGGQLTKLELALEEVVTNVMRHAYAPDLSGVVEVGCRSDRSGRLFVQVRDRGCAFDPLAQPEADLELSLDERPVGKLGIFLLKELTRSVSYERIDGMNVLTFAVGSEPEDK